MTEAAVRYDVMVDPAQHIVRACDLPQLADRAGWLAPRLRSLFPGYQDSHIMGWLRTMAGTNGTSNYRLVCTDNAVALSEHRNEKLVIAPFIIDHFVVVNEGADISEGQALYMDMNRWGMSIGASEIHINPKSDVPRPLIEEVMGKTTERKILCAKVGK